MIILLSPSIFSLILFILLSFNYVSIIHTFLYYFFYYQNFHNVTKTCPGQCNFSNWRLNHRPNYCLHSKARQCCNRIDLWRIVKTERFFATAVQIRLALYSTAPISVTVKSIWSKECVLIALIFWQQRAMILLYKINPLPRNFL